MGALSVSLKSGEKIYINGAMVRVDRRVCLEFLNDVTFLLQNHVISPEEAKTPLKQIYFIIQTLLIDPQKSDETYVMLRNSFHMLMQILETPSLIKGLKEVEELVQRQRLFDSLKTLRNLFPLEEDIMAKSNEDTLYKYTALEGKLYYEHHQ